MRGLISDRFLKKFRGNLKRLQKDVDSTREAQLRDNQDGKMESQENHKAEEANRKEVEGIKSEK